MPGTKVESAAAAGVLAVAARPVRIEEIGGWREFLQLREVWRRLAASDADGVLLGHDWVVQSWKCCAELGQGERPCVLGLRGGDGWEGFVALRHNRRTRRLCFLDEQRSQRLDLLGRPDGRGWELVAKYLLSRRDWDRLDLFYLREPSARAIADTWPGWGLAVRERGRVVQRWVDLRRPWREVEADFSLYLRANMRRRYKRLQAHGAVELQEFSRRPDLMSALEECFALEKRGWKGANGTAVLDDANLHRFYRQLAARLAGRGEFRLFCLRVGERLAAFEYCVADRNAQRLNSLKIAYAEELRTASPGVVLRWLLLQRVQGEFAAYDFLGDDAPWKGEWTPQVTELRHLRVFNRTLRGQMWRWRAQAWAVIRGDRSGRVLG